MSTDEIKFPHKLDDTRLYGWFEMNALIDGLLHRNWPFDTINAIGRIVPPSSAFALILSPHFAGHGWPSDIDVSATATLMN